MGKQVENIFVYGDSYSDTNSRTLKTNGPVWSQRVAAAWDAELKSYAQIGAHSCPKDKSPLSLAQQLENAEQSISATPQNNVHAVFIGVTDLSDTQDKTAATSLIECIKKQIMEIYRLDPEGRILLIGPPPVESAPFFSKHPKQFEVKQRATEFNVGLEDAVTEWQTDTNIRVEFVDLYVLFGAVMSDPSEYNIQDVEQAYWDVCQGTCSDPMDSYLWWDNIHMTGAGHLAIANEITSKKPFGILSVNANHPESPKIGDYSTDQIENSTSGGMDPFFASAFLFFVICGLLLFLMRPAKVVSMFRSCLRSRKSPRKDCYSAV